MPATAPSPSARDLATAHSILSDVANRIPISTSHTMIVVDAPRSGVSDAAAALVGSSYIHADWDEAEGKEGPVVANEDLAKLDDFLAKNKPRVGTELF